MGETKTDNAFYALIDWGTSSFRLWIVDENGGVLAQSRSDEGMMYASENGFSETLEKHLAASGAPVDLPVVISGMAGARQGWKEAPYVSLPSALSGMAAHSVKIDHATRDIRILPGMAQNTAQNPNVMRGEETQLAGIANTMPDGLVCMPGTHCKWVELKDSSVTGLTSFMTGEIFSVLSKYSILKHAMDPQTEFDAQNPAFLRAMRQALVAPGQVFSMFFSIRAGQLLGFEQQDEGAAHLSGLLIGAEIAAAKQIYGAGTAGLVASDRLNALYLPVMQEAGFTVSLFDGEDAVRIGLLTAAKQIKVNAGS